MKEIELLSLIPYGRENAVSRHELQRLTGMNDRAVRLEIKRLLRTGEPILSSCKHSGYWRSENVAEWKEFINESKSRAESEYKNIEAMEKKLSALC